VLKEGDQAPDFKVLADDGQAGIARRLSRERSDFVFLSEGQYAGCIHEAKWLPQHDCGFPGHRMRAIAGVSADTVEDQSKFSKKLGPEIFPLLADTGI